MSKTLALKGHYHDGGQCERKLLSLKKEYRDEVHRQSQTGAPSACQFPNFYDMEELMSEDATVKPPITVAAGVGGHIVVNNVSTEESTRGLKKPTSLKRPKALVERKVKAIEDIAEAMQKRYSP